MLADIVDHVIGIDPDRDQITASLVEASTGGELATGPLGASVWPESLLPQQAMVLSVRSVPTSGPFTPEGYAERMELYERAMSTLMALLANGAFFSDRVEHDRLWVRCTELLATRTQEQAGLTVLVDMQQYPTLLALYALALGALAADRVDSIARVLTDITVQERSVPMPVAVAAASLHVLKPDTVKRSLDGFANRKTPVSHHLCDLMGPAMSSIVADQQRLEDLFDEMEAPSGQSPTSALTSAESNSLTPQELLRSLPGQHGCACQTPGGRPVGETPLWPSGLLA